MQGKLCVYVFRVTYTNIQRSLCKKLKESFNTHKYHYINEGVSNEKNQYGKDVFLNTFKYIKEVSWAKPYVCN